MTLEIKTPTLFTDFIGRSTSVIIPPAQVIEIDKAISTNNSANDLHTPSDGADCRGNSGMSTLIFPRVDGSVSGFDVVNFNSGQ